MQDFEIVFNQDLEKRGLKLTKARRYVLETVFELHKHFNTQDLYEKIKSKISGISLATVYRTLPLLVEAGLVQYSIRKEGKESYEHIFGHPKHIHWLCHKCGTLIETDLKEIYPIIMRYAKELEFEPDDISLNIRGLCWKCKLDDKENHLHEK